MPATDCEVELSMETMLTLCPLEITKLKMKDLTMVRFSACLL